MPVLAAGCADIVATSRGPQLFGLDDVKVDRSKVAGRWPGRWARAGGRVKRRASWPVEGRGSWQSLKAVTGLAWRHLAWLGQRSTPLRFLGESCHLSTFSPFQIGDTSDMPHRAGPRLEACCAVAWPG